MPAKGTIAKYHGRHSVIDRKLWKKYVNTTGDKISYEEFKLIINLSLTETKKWILKMPSGFKFPGRIGTMAINKLKTYGAFKTFLRMPDSTFVLNHNLKTNGHVFRIQWFHATRSNKERINLWYFSASRLFKRELAKTLKEESYPLYNTFMQDHFVIKHYS